MRSEGTLSKWNDDRGFGFIAPTQGGQEVFVHISMFPKDGARPTLGERLTFQLETDNNGRLRAKNLLCPERPTVKRAPRAPARRPGSYYRKQRPGAFTRIVRLLAVVGLAAFGYGEYARRNPAPTSNAAKTEIEAPSHAYSCDGRTRCPQMTSCGEATFFLRNCPNVEMDGDHDGVACEQQWCTGE
jgi:cold shock CspA family protein